MLHYSQKISKKCWKRTWFYPGEMLLNMCVCVCVVQHELLHFFSQPNSISGEEPQVFTILNQHMKFNHINKSHSTEYQDEDICTFSSIFCISKFYLPDYKQNI